MKRIIFTYTIFIFSSYLCFAKETNFGFGNKYCVWGKQGEAVKIELPTRIVELYAPFAIENCDMYSDGGTIFITIKDSKGTIFSFCHDGRMRSYGVPSKEVFANSDRLKEFWAKEQRMIENEPWYFYVETTYPTHEGAQKIPIGGKEEKSLLFLLQGWANAQLSKDDQESFLKDQYAWQRKHSTLAGAAHAQHILRMMSSLSKHIHQANVSIGRDTK